MSSHESSRAAVDCSPEGAAPRHDQVGTAGAVLAGGRASRFGGIDKGWLEFEGQPLVRIALERLRPQVDALLVCANRSLQRYRELGVMVVDDGEAGVPAFEGPLAGIVAALATAGRPWIAIVPCDAPRLPPDLVARLRQACDAQGADAAVARCAGRIEPLFSLWSAALLPRLREALAGGTRRVDEGLRLAAAVPVDFDDPEAFTNLNTPQDLKRHGRNPPSAA